MDLHMALEAAMAHLAPTQRKLLEQHYREGRTSRELAKDMGTTVMAVEQALYRARRDLRAELCKTPWLREALS